MTLQEAVSRLTGLPHYDIRTEIVKEIEQAERVLEDEVSRLQEAEQQRDDYREIIVRLKDALGLQLDGEEFTPEKVADRILDPYDRLQGVVEENEEMRELLQKVIDISTPDNPAGWSITTGLLLQIKALLAELESSAE